MTTREKAFQILQTFLNDELLETIEGAHLINFVETDNGTCAEFARHWDSETYLYFGCLFNDGFVVITINNTEQQRFSLDNNELDDVLDAFHELGYY